MSHRYFSHSSPGPRRINRDEAMHLAVELYSRKRFATIRLQSAAVVVKLEPAYSRDQSVRRRRWQLASKPAVLSIGAPARNHVVAFVELLKQPSNVRRIVLKI